MPAYHYTKADVVCALQDVGIKPGDIVFVHSNIGYLGRAKNTDTAADVCDLILDSFLEVLGVNGTLVVPTFTYSFANGLIFNHLKTASNCGIFSESIRNNQNAIRSADPNISVAAIGKKSVLLTKNVPENAYGAESFFDRFYKQNGKICNINFDAGSTFVHYVERRMGVPYRFDKTFSGVYIDEVGNKSRRNSTIWVRHLQHNTKPRFEELSRLVTLRNLFVRAKLGRGFVGCISANNAYSFIQEHLKESPMFLTNFYDFASPYESLSW